MDDSPIQGFITRKQAAERCQRAERTLQRYWSRAIEHQDKDVLEHLKLRTEAGKIIEGPDVTKDLIDQLKKTGQNPTWFVHASWVQKAYGPRDRAARPQTHGGPASTETPSSPEAPESREPALVAALKEQIAELQRDKDRLHQELGIKNEQIKEANARTRESNTLMQQLQMLLGEVQHRALPASSSQPSSPIRDGDFIQSAPTSARTRQPDAQAPESTGKGTARRKKTPSRKKTAPTSAPNRRSPAKKPAPPKAGSEKPRWYDTPTFKRLASRLRR